MKVIEIKPKPFFDWQKEVIKNLRDVNVVVAPRQHGKTYLMTWLIASVVFDKNIESPLILLTSDSKPRIFDLYKDAFDQMFQHNPSYSWTNKDQSSIRIKRPQGDYATIVIRGSLLTPHSAKGLSPNLIVMDEAGLCHPDTFMESLAPSTDFTKGIIIITGTVENNWYYQTFLKAQKKVAQGSKNWSYFYMQHGDKWSLGVHTPKRLGEIKDKYDFDDPEDLRKFNKEQMCDWASATTGTIYSNDVIKMRENKQIVSVPLLPTNKVGLTWDDGIGCTAVWVWQLNYGIPRLVKYIEWRQVGLHEICKDIVEWVKSNRTSIGCMVVPHTMFHKIQSEQGMPTVLDKVVELLKYKETIIAIPKVGDKSKKEKALRYFFKNALFDSVSCAEGLRQIQLYNPDAPRNLQKKWSHATDSLSELAVAYMDGHLNLDLQSKMSYNTQPEYEEWNKPIEKRYTILYPY